MGKKEKAAAKAATLARATVTAETTEGTTPAVPEIPMLDVDMKKAYEGLRGKKEVPADLAFTTRNKRSINVYTAYDAVFTALVPETTETVAVSRRQFLQVLCTQNQLTPAQSTRSNKNENKSVATYGEVVQFEDGFDVDGEAYRIFGWLKHPIWRSGRISAIKYGTYLLVMPNATFDSLVKGEILADAKVRLIG